MSCFGSRCGEDAAADDEVRDAGEENTLDNFAYVFDKKLEELVPNRMDRNSTQAVRFLDSQDVREFIT